MLIAVVNHSTLVTDHDVSTMTRAVATQVHRHVAPAWERMPAAVVFYDNDTIVPPGAHTIAVLDDADQAGVLGWHTEDRDVIYGRVFARPVLDNNGDALHKSLSIASVLSHEVIEMFCDPSVNMWAEDGDGTMYAVEACDPVEADTYPVTAAKVTVSNFVTPAWFDAQAAPADEFDHLDKLKAPFTLTAGGYVVYERAGSVHQRFGEHYPLWRRATKKTPLARTARRREHVSR